MCAVVENGYQNLVDKFVGIFLLEISTLEGSIKLKFSKNSCTLSENTRFLVLFCILCWLFVKELKQVKIIIIYM